MSYEQKIKKCNAIDKLVLESVRLSEPNPRVYTSRKQTRGSHSYIMAIPNHWGLQNTLTNSDSNMVGAWRYTDGDKQPSA